MNLIINDKTIFVSRLLLWGFLIVVCRTFECEHEHQMVSIVSVDVLLWRWMRIDDVTTYWNSIKVGLINRSSNDRQRARAHTLNHSQQHQHHQHHQYYQNAVAKIGSQNIIIIIIIHIVIGQKNAACNPKGLCCNGIAYYTTSTQLNWH